MNNYLFNKVRIKQNKEIENKIIDLRNLNHTITEIANLLNISRSKVYTISRLNKLGERRSLDLALRKNRATKIRLDYKNGMEYKDLLEKYNICLSFLSQVINNSIYHDNNYSSCDKINQRNVVVSIETIKEIRSRYDNGDCIFDIIDTYKHLYKSNSSKCIRKICLRQSFKGVK